MPELFDWIRWVEVPAIIALLGLVIKHAVHDHAVELRLTELVTRAMERAEGINELEKRIDRRLEMLEWRLSGRQTPPPVAE